MSNDQTEAYDPTFPIDPSAVCDAIGDAVYRAVSAVVSLWTPLPPGSHLMIPTDDKSGFKRGIDVVALRESRWGSHGEIMTEKGAVFSLDSETRLVIGRGSIK